DYADVVDLNSTKLGFLDTYSWSHYLPGDFNSSMNSVTDAKLWISASGVLCDYTTVANIQGFGEWVFLNGQDWHLTWNWNIVFTDQTSETVIDMPTSMENYAFWEQNPINVCVGTGQFFSSVTLEQSVLMMDYNNTPPSNGEPTASTVPEPTTLTLFGLGLLGMSYIRRRRAQK
ncbi:MAG: PEP-CTERM sorting domain-containing protein, partial [candidate division Zixibacteria bacterium]|nr:PEP-CTERM sorting domain-containing protein [candidate division Zixibacteria bacterium]